MGKVHGSLARAGKVKSQTRRYPALFDEGLQLTVYSQGKHLSSNRHDRVHLAQRLLEPTPATIHENATLQHYNRRTRHGG